MQWETATPVGFPVCRRHKDCRLKDSGVKTEAEMKQQVVFHTPSAPEREGDDIQVLLVTICLGQGTLLSPFQLLGSGVPHLWEKNRKGGFHRGANLPRVGEKIVTGAQPTPPTNVGIRCQVSSVSRVRGLATLSLQP